MRKDWLTTLLLCVFLGPFGAHRFYVGKVKSGLLYLFTYGLCGVGWFIDLIQIITGSFTDARGNYVTRNVQPYYSNANYTPQKPYNFPNTSQPGSNTGNGKSSLSTTAICGIVLAVGAVLLLASYSDGLNAANIIISFVWAVLCLLYLWFFVVLKMLREANIVKEDEVPDAFNPFKKKEDKIIDKPQGRFLGYEESLEGMYAEHYEAMQFYNNLKLFLDDNPNEKAFDMGPVKCSRYTGKDTPEWHEAFYMFDMNGMVALIIYNDGNTIYTLKKGQWYVADLPESEREPDLQQRYPTAGNHSRKILL